ncbi:MAG: hypothetical protein ABI972_25425 [Acidobacteriota bacterium]
MQQPQPAPQPQPTQPAPSAAFAAAVVQRKAQLSAVATMEQSMNDAWAPANAVEEHLVRKISGLGVTIESMLRTLSVLDPETKANLISSYTLTLIRLQKTQSSLETELRGIQSQRGIRATHPYTCELLPTQADARPYVRESGSRPTVFKPVEPITAPEGMPEEARQVLEAHFGTRVRPAGEMRDGKMIITPKLIQELAANLRPTAKLPSVKRTAQTER